MPSLEEEPRPDEAPASVELPAQRSEHSPFSKTHLLSKLSARKAALIDVNKLLDSESLNPPRRESDIELVFDDKEIEPDAATDPSCSKDASGTSQSDREGAENGSTEGSLSPSVQQAAAPPGAPADGQGSHGNEPTTTVHGDAPIVHVEEQQAAGQSNADIELQCMAKETPIDEDSVLQPVHHRDDGSAAAFSHQQSICDNERLATGTVHAPVADAACTVDSDDEFGDLGLQKGAQVGVVDENDDNEVVGTEECVMDRGEGSLHEPEGLEGQDEEFREREADEGGEAMRVEEDEDAEELTDVLDEEAAGMEEAEDDEEAALLRAIQQERKMQDRMLEKGHDQGSRYFDGEAEQSEDEAVSSDEEENEDGIRMSEDEIADMVKELRETGIGEQQLATAHAEWLEEQDTNMLKRLVRDVKRGFKKGRKRVQDDVDDRDLEDARERRRHMVQSEYGLSEVDPVSSMSTQQMMRQYKRKLASLAVPEPASPVKRRPVVHALQDDMEHDENDDDLNLPSIPEADSPCGLAHLSKRTQAKRAGEVHTRPPGPSLLGRGRKNPAGTDAIKGFSRGFLPCTLGPAQGGKGTG